MSVQSGSWVGPAGLQSSIIALKYAGEGLPGVLLIIEVLILWSHAE